MIFSFVIGANGQKKKLRSETAVAPPKPFVVKKRPAEKTDATPKYTAVIEINENLRFGVTFIDNDYFTKNSADTAWVENLFFSLNRQAQSRKTNLSEIIVKPDAALSFGEISGVLKKLRKSANQDLKIQLEDYTSLEISKPLPKQIAPNPFFLLVDIKENNEILLNNEDLGSIDDLSGLKKSLEEIFKDRLDNGVFREGSNEVEQTIFIRAAASVKILEINKVVKVLKEVGANPIGLQIDDFVRTANVEPIVK